MNTRTTEDQTTAPSPSPSKHLLMNVNSRESTTAPSESSDTLL
jgi:hypothetical protein